MPCLVPWAGFAEQLAEEGAVQAAALPSGHVSLSAVLSAALVSAWGLLCFVLICPLHYVPEIEGWISL